ncbi:MAG: amine oxidase [Acidiferrobacteraceae bacterium]|nr:amine oxidase [Acidiferrobacteraceae bacterium]
MSVTNRIECKFGIPGVLNHLHMNTDIVVIGAGAAGIAAAKYLQSNGVAYLLIEANNRVGGRAFTELMADGTPFDLGCHWMHSASINPFVSIADELGIRYEKRTGYGSTQLFRNREALSMEMSDTLTEALLMDDRCIRKIWMEGKDISVYDALDATREWSSVADYFTALNTSVDVDKVSIGDIVEYEDTNENWPVVDGYGALVNKWANDVPVNLNTKVRSVDWSGSGVRIETSKGNIAAKCVILTVSTGVLGSRHIRFTPELPILKSEAIEALPMGNYNRIRLSVRPRSFDVDVPERVLASSQTDLPMSLSIRPYGFDCVVGLVAGRYADWLEKAGPAASVDAVGQQLSSVFGANILQCVTGDRQSAWRGDPLSLGAYSAATPGNFGQRSRLAKPVADKIYFAGEATSTSHFCTCHGAMLTGYRAAHESMNSLS